MYCLLWKVSLILNKIKDYYILYEYHFGHIDIDWRCFADDR